MARRTSRMKVRGRNNKEEKRIYAIVTEGVNKTETIYFRSFQKQKSDFVLRTIKAGHTTDVKGLYKIAERQWNFLGLRAENGDRIFVVLDIDNDKRKAELVKSVAEKSTNIQIIASNPCFEVWFLLHFSSSAKAYLNNRAVLEELKRYIPDYEKNKDVSKHLYSKMENAIHNCENIIHFWKTNGKDWPSVECNPRTDAIELVKMIKP